MISVIVPTMLLCPYDVFIYTLTEMQSNPLIGEIIIINNSQKSILDELLITKDKLVILDQSSNIGVNPAWNLGISMAKYENYVIINDDVLCYSSIYNKCEYILRENDRIGLVTVKTINNITKNEYSKLKSSDIINISTSISNNGRIGWFMAGRVREWVIIPKEFTIFYGDDIIYLGVAKNNKNSVMINSENIGHFTSATSREFSTYLYKELPHWQNYIKAMSK